MDAVNDTNQHYITKAYLDKFVHPQSGQNVLYPYRKGGSACRPRGTKQLGSAINFYRQRHNGELTDKLDDARRKSEEIVFASGKRTTGSIAKCVFEDTFVPTPDDKVQLAMAAALLFCGSPVQIHNAAMHLLLVHQMHAFNRLNTKEAHDLYRERYGESAEERLDEDRQKMLKGELFVDVGEENWRQLGFNSLLAMEEVIKLLLAMKLTIVDCHPRCFFLTSDNPAIRIYPSSHGKLDDEMWFPISYKRALLWHRRSLGNREQLGYSQSHARNRLTIKYSYKFVYSPLSEDWVETAVRSTTFDPLLGHYGSLQQVLDQARPAYDQWGRRLSGDIVETVSAIRSGDRLDVVRI